MTTPLRVLAFLGAVALVFVAAFGVGNAVGPLDAGSPEPHTDMSGDEPGGHDGDDEEVGLPGGLAVSQDGYALRLADATAEPGRRVPLRFVVAGPDGQPVTEFDVEHEKRLHLVAVRRDLTGFQHVHPTMAGDGTWSAHLDLEPGSWRVFADFVPSGGTGTTLGADLSVPGDFRPVPSVTEARSVEVDGYTVSVTGDLVAGEASPLTLSVQRGGRPVTDLQPYLGAHGHLVALRVGDLAYLHVHPEEDGGSGPEVSFVAEVPSAGDYRLFLDFKHGDRVRTAELALSTEGAHDDEH